MKRHIKYFLPLLVLAVFIPFTVKQQKELPQIEQNQTYVCDKCGSDHINIEYINENKESVEVVAEFCRCVHCPNNWLIGEIPVDYYRKSRVEKLLKQGESNE